MARDPWRVTVQRYPRRDGASVRAGREPVRTQAGRIDLGLLRSLSAGVLAHIILAGRGPGPGGSSSARDAGTIDALACGVPGAACDYAGLFSAVAEPPATGAPG